MQKSGTPCSRTGRNSGYFLVFGLAFTSWGRFAGVRLAAADLEKTRSHPVVNFLFEPV